MLVMGASCADRWECLRLGVLFGDVDDPLRAARELGNDFCFLIEDCPSKADDRMSAEGLSGAALRSVLIGLGWRSSGLIGAE